MILDHNFYLCRLLLSLSLIIFSSNFSYAQTQFTAQKNRLTEQQQQNNNNLDKITFDISLISPDGLIGNKDNLRSLSYEFCIPKNPQFIAEIKQIDPEITFSQSQGRIGCNKNQYLAIGDTHKSNWLEILKAIANLDYVEKIDQFFGE